MFSDIKLVVRLVGHPRDLGAVLDHGALPHSVQAAMLLPARCLLWNALQTQLRHRARSEKCQFRKSRRPCLPVQKRRPVRDVADGAKGMYFTSRQWRAGTLSEIGIG
jgi:hypothetical protein